MIRTWNICTVEAWVWSLVEELRSQTPCSAAKKKKKSQLWYHLFLLWSDAYNSPTPLTPTLFPAIWLETLLCFHEIVCNCSFAYTYGIIVTVYPCILGLGILWVSHSRNLQSYCCKAHDVENHSARLLKQEGLTPCECRTSTQMAKFYGYLSLANVNSSLLLPFLFHPLPNLLLNLEFSLNS